MKKMKIAGICTGILLSIQMYSQNIPMGSLPMLYNGGFAGEAGNARLNAGTTYFWNYSSSSNVKSIHRSYFASYDQFIPKLRTGFGLSVIENHQFFKRSRFFPKEPSQFDNLFVIASLSPKISLRGKCTFAPFINFIYAGIGSYHITNPEVISSDPDLIQFERTTHNSISGKAGFLFNTKKFYVGFSINKLNPDVAVYTNELHAYPFHKRNINLIDDYNSVYPDKYPVYNNYKGNLSYQFQVGYTFQKLPESKFSFTPQLAVQSLINNAFITGYGYWRERKVRYDVNLMFRYNKFIWSLNNNGLGIGYQKNNTRLLLSQNFITLDRKYDLVSLTCRVVLKTTAKVSPY